MRNAVPGTTTMKLNIPNRRMKDKLEALLSDVPGEFSHPRIVSGIARRVEMFMVLRAWNSLPPVPPVFRKTVTSPQEGDWCREVGECAAIFRSADCQLLLSGLTAL
jgi:hypothetical protein